VPAVTLPLPEGLHQHWITHPITCSHRFEEFAANGAKICPLDIELKWMTEVSSSVYATPLITDLYADGRKDIIVPGVYACVGAACLYGHGQHPALAPLSPWLPLLAVQISSHALCACATCRLTSCAWHSLSWSEEKASHAQEVSLSEWFTWPA
jgi:hypothetical protein